MSVREVITVRSEATKIGVVNSAVASIRSQAETETAVRLIDEGQVGLASTVGPVSLDELTKRAQDALVFEVPYEVEPESGRSMSESHLGERRTEDELVRLTESVLGPLREAHPDFIFSHGVEQKHLEWHIRSDAGLDLSYSRDTTTLAFIAKEKGSGNIIDTFVGTEADVVDVDAVSRVFGEHLDAFGRQASSATGRQRVVFPGLNGMAGGALMSLFRSDLLGRTYAQGASFFDGRIGDGEPHLSTALSIAEVRDPTQAKVCPFDMEGVIREPLNLEIVREGQLVSLAANKRDALRYGLPQTGTAIGGAGQLPSSGFGHLAPLPTAESLSALLGPEGGILVWFVAGGDCTRAGDLALPAQVLLGVDGDGLLTGRVAGATLTGNVMDVFGRDYVGSTVERVDPFSDEGFFVTHMNVVR
jgi:predicted Zn-dependent protease